ncbi:M16 family metallopeptidase [Chiayiivirga flava]|uniref:Zinc protease n=1 Tax=Chiayiivirga flava TaxID=659595 RepID=A0A7W8DA04_9GAMM|nr:pitrilysin family protein [Chiayiivirga flava]MBB5209507.1 zinc protease [Chiayiivirga flava]
MPLFRFAALALALTAVAAHAAPAAVPGADAIVTRTLDNGLKIVVWPDHDIPNVAVYTWYRAGGRNEYPGITGLAHYFEHMMFNGTSTRAPGEFDRTMENAGGSNNAYTSNDVTVYQDWFPKDALDIIFDLESDRMANLDFDPKVVESERGVVYSERRSSVDENNIGALVEQMQATAYIAHPYQFPVIGWPSDIERWTIDDLKTFYRTYYAPNNATMFVVGDVEPDTVFALAQKYFAKIPRQAPPKAVTTVEPEQRGERRVTLEKADAQTPVLALAYHVGNARHEDATATELLVSILADGDSSRLHQRIVEQEQAAIGIGSNVEQGFDPGLVFFYALLPPEGDVAKVEALFDEELARIVREGITPAELAKATKQHQAAFWRAIATISGKAQALGSHEIFHGDYNALFDAPTQVAGVTGAQIQAVAARVLRTSNRTVGVLKPVPGAADAADQE